MEYLAESNHVLFYYYCQYLWCFNQLVVGVLETNSAVLDEFEYIADFE